MLFREVFEAALEEVQDKFIIGLSGLDANEKAAPTSAQHVSFHQDFILKGVDMQIEPEFSICHSIGAVSSF